MAVDVTNGFIEKFRNLSAGFLMCNQSGQDDFVVSGWYHGPNLVHGLYLELPQTWAENIYKDKTYLELLPILLAFHIW
jgi:hypothetical protein